MISPNHDCWWTKNKTTKLEYNDSTLSGAGLSLAVLFPCCQTDNQIWFSAADRNENDSEEDEFENIEIVGLPADSDASVTRKPYTTIGPISRTLKLSGISEFVLSDEVLLQLGIRSFDDLFSAAHADINARLYLHDDCYFSISSVSDNLLGVVLGRILELHDGYFGRPMDWSAAKPQIINELKSHEKILIKSNPESTEFEISWKEPGWLSGFLQTTHKETLVMVESKASK